IAGVVVGSRQRIDEARGVVTRLGIQAAALDCWLAARGLRTLHLRVECSQSSARVLAERLREHAAVRAVHHPGWGPMVTFDLGEQARAEQLFQACPEIHLAPSLGGVESSFSHPASSSHRSLAPEERTQLGIGPGLVRLSVGVEDVEDLWSELNRGLAKL
ncbi:MAG TPA: PLP-dependent transferase, partial [Polyangiales bacterium]